MPERFESRFGDEFNNVKGNKKIVKTGTNIDDIIDFFQSEIDLAVAEKEKEIVGEIRQKTLESWYEALTLSINKDGGVSPDVNLDLMGKILLKKVSLITNNSDINK